MCHEFSPENFLIFKKLFFFFVFCLFRAIPPAYGGSQAKGRIRAVAAITAHSNAGSLTH